MTTHAEREAAWEEFLELWDVLLTETADPRTVIVVEGERDRESLERLGLRGSIVPLHRGQRLASVARGLGLKARRVILLTDWDTEGGHLAQKLRELLEAGPVEVDLELRKRLAICLRGELAHVEGLFGWARRNAERHGASLEHFRPLTAPGSDPTG